MSNTLAEAAALCEREPRTTDYCLVCGHSPDSGSHLPHGHAYVAPWTLTLASTVPALLAEVQRLTGECASWRGTCKSLAAQAETLTTERDAYDLKARRLGEMLGDAMRDIDRLRAKARR